MEDERGPGLDFSLFCVRQSSARGCRFSFVFVYFIIKVFKCSPVPGSFFPYLLTSLRCTYHFIDKLVFVQYIVKFYAEKHTGARCESLNKRRSCRSYCVMKSLMLCIK